MPASFTRRGEGFLGGLSTWGAAVVSQLAPFSPRAASAPHRPLAAAPGAPVSPGRVSGNGSAALAACVVHSYILDLCPGR